MGTGVAFLVLLIAALAAVHVPLGDYMYRVYSSAKHSRAERLVYRALPSVSVAVGMAVAIAFVRGLAAGEAEKRAVQLLDYMKLGKRGDHRPAELSGGEQQRVAIARAVANAPMLLLADEPTGNLDPATANHVFTALEALVRQSGLAALIATHNHELADRMDRRVTLADGKIVPM